MNAPARLVAFILAAAALASGACIAHRPTRTFDALEFGAGLKSTCPTALPPKDDCGNPYGTTPADGRVCTSTDTLMASDTERKLVSCYAHEKHRAVATGAYPHDGFDLHVVEFDDEGQLWNADRQEVTLAQLRNELRSKGALVAVFVHGWKNDASVCNGNISCFRDVLEVLAKIEHAYPFGPPQARRRVIGIYIGWRGGAISATGVKQLTFWGRKHAAHTIGDNGGVTAFIRRLRTVVDEGREAYAESIGKKGEPAATSMVLVGHSFGAALLYSALGTSINGDAGAALEAAKKNDLGGNRRQTGPAQAMVTDDGRIRVPSQGDLVMLVNPAMEASRFANLSSAVKLRYDPLQTPILVTLGSEGDSAVKYFFPVGQSFSTVLRSARSRRNWFSMVEGFGLYQPYLTHRLTRSNYPLASKGDDVGDPCRCQSRLREYGDDLVKELKPYYDAIYANAAASVGRGDVAAAARNVPSLGGYQEFRFSRLEPLTDIDPNTPFLMVQVDREVIGDHSKIFNAPFLDFVIEFTVRSELKRRLQNENLPQSAVAKRSAGQP
jgi:hypothetical protein